MTAHYLLKTEPSEYSFADLSRDRETIWDGVTNPQALRNLRNMNPGDLLVIYETGDVKSAVGEARVVTARTAGAKEPEVKIRAAKPLHRAVSLSEMKANELFADSPLARQGRLSVVPLTPEQYRYIVGRQGREA